MRCSEDGIGDIQKLARAIETVGLIPAYKSKYDINIKE